MYSLYSKSFQLTIRYVYQLEQVVPPVHKAINKSPFLAGQSLVRLQLLAGTVPKAGVGPPLSPVGNLQQKKGIAVLRNEIRGEYLAFAQG